MAVYNSIQLDLCKKNSYKAIPTKQLDTNSRFLRVELLNNGSQYDFNDDVTVILASTRNGETKAYKCTVEDGCVVAPLTSWMLAEEGYVDCEIVLIDTASNSKLSSFAFSICVDESIYNDETISQDENYNVLLQLITDVDTAVKSCNTATEKATEIYNTVETKLNNGELKGEKGDKGDKGDPYELTTPDIEKIINQIPSAKNNQRGLIKVPFGCGIEVDDDGAAKVRYPVTSVKSTTDDIKIAKHTGGSTDGQHDLTFNSEKYVQKSELPKKTSDLQNDSGYITADDAPSEVYIGSERPQGNEVIWVDDSTNPENINVSKAYVDEKNSNKQDAPKEQGTSGQVLGLDDELQIQWQDPRPSRIIAETTITDEQVYSISFTNLDLSNVTEIFIIFSTPSNINLNSTNGDLIIKSNGISASPGVAFNGWNIYINKLSLISVKKLNNIIVWDYYQNKSDGYWWGNNGTLYRKCSNSNIEFGKNSTINITLWDKMFPKGFTVKIGVIE